jgi:hypothetical protein
VCRALDDGALLAHQVALCRRWEERGVRGAAVAGDGVGELAARHVPGPLTLRAAAHGTLCPSGAAPPRAEHRLRSAGHTHLLERGPYGPAEDARVTVGVYRAVRTAPTHLHRPTPAIGLPVRLRHPEQ